YNRTSVESNRGTGPLRHSRRVVSPKEIFMPICARWLGACSTLIATIVVGFAIQNPFRYTSAALPTAKPAALAIRKATAKVFYSVRWPDHAQIISMDADGSERTCLTPLTN